MTEQEKKELEEGLQEDLEQVRIENFSIGEKLVYRTPEIGYNEMFYEYGDGRIELVSTITREIIKVVKEGTGHNPYLKVNG